jgi:hypothetical protein
MSHDDSMTRLAGSDPVDRLIASLIQEREPALRAATLLRLAESAGSRIWPNIEAMLESDSVIERVAAVVAAEKTRHFQLEDRITKEVASDDAQLAAAAARAISKLGDLRTQAMLLALLGCSNQNDE